MALKKSTFKRWNQDTTQWDIHYFRTSADIIDETTSYKVMTAAERTAISTYLNAFNAANKLLKLDGSGLIPIALIPGGLDYLTTNNPAFTGTMTGVLYKGIWAEDSTLLKIDSHHSDFGGVPAYIKFTSGQGDYVDAEISGTEIKLLSTTGVDVNNKVIKNVATPTSGHHATNKTYVDSLVATGTKPKDTVKAATTGPITLSGLQPIDGYTTIAGDRILVKDQGTGSQNGIYTASATGWSKITAESVTGILVFVENGITQNDYHYYASTDTSWIVFSRVDTIGVIAAGGLEKVGTNLGIKTAGVTSDMLAGSIPISKLGNSTINDNLGAFDNPSYPTANAAMGFVAALNASLSAIKQIRGTASYKTENTQTIAGAYTLASAKNRIYIGASDPATTGYINGDIYLQDIV